MAPEDDEALGGDVTQIRLLDWRQGQAPSEYLAALILDAEGYKDIDPSHPLGGPDGGLNGHCTKDGQPWTWAVYFPRGQQDLRTIETKLSGDIDGARKHSPDGVVFVTNQELRLAERKKLRGLGGDLPIDLIHLYRVATILDRPQMARTRQQYLKIGAGRPPVQVRAEVIGVARAFNNGGDELLEMYVEWYEEKVREESDKGWARVKAEEEEKARAEAAKIRAKAEKDRRETLESLDRDKPISIADMAMRSMPSFQDLGPKYSFKDIMPKYDIPPFDPSSYVGSLLGGRYGAAEPAPPPEPLTDEQINGKVAINRAKLEARWESCKDYLAGVTWPGLKFRIHNAEGFLTNAQVVLTFHGARGLDYEYIEGFVWEKVQDPSWTEPYDPIIGRMPMAATAFRPLAANQNPVEWDHDDNGDLVVKITLPQLRPQEVWTSDDDDVVLVVRGENLDSVKVTYTITAHEHHDRVDGKPFTLPVEGVDIFDSVQAGIDALEKPE